MGSPACALLRTFLSASVISLIVCFFFLKLFLKENKIGPSRDRNGFKKSCLAKLGVVALREVEAGRSV